MNCLVCGRDLGHRRADAKTCSPKCRRALSRRRGVVMQLPARGPEAVGSLSEAELVGIVETAARGGSWGAARWLLERLERKAVSVEPASPFEDILADARRRRADFLDAD